MRAKGRTATTKKKKDKSATKTRRGAEGGVRHYRWAEIEEEQLNPTVSRMLVVGKNEMLGYVRFKKGAIVPAHKHVSEQITFILKGLLKFTIDGNEYPVKAGEVLVIPPNVIHEAVAMEDTDDLDCFSPLRKDWLTGKDQYLRTGRSFLKRKT